MSARIAAFVALGAIVGVTATEDTDAGTSRRLFGNMGQLPGRTRTPKMPSMETAPVAEIQRLEAEGEQMKQEILNMEYQLDQMEYLKQRSAQGQQGNAEDQAGWSTGSMLLGGLSGMALLAAGIKGGLSAVSRPDTTSRTSAISMSMAEEGTADTQEPMARREFLSKVAGASALLGATAANAEVDYAGVGFLGGSSTIDVNNANVRVYIKLPGMYPNAAGKIVSKAPYKDKADMYAKCGFTGAEAETVKKYDKNFIFLDPRPEYVIDNINNGLYR